MGSRLVWLFAAHKELWEKCHAVEMELELLKRSSAKELKETTDGYESKLKDLETQLAQKSNPLDLSALAEELFQDRPYEGRIPDDAWLTPGANDRTER